MRKTVVGQNGSHRRIRFWSAGVVSKGALCLHPSQQWGERRSPSRLISFIANGSGIQLHWADVVWVRRGMGAPNIPARIRSSCYCSVLQRAIPAIVSSRVHRIRRRRRRRQPTWDLIAGTSIIFMSDRNPHFSVGVEGGPGHWSADQ